jgi:hypothetical protein
MSSASETIAPPPAERANGLQTYLKVFYAPSEAFTTLARVPTWGWAAIAGVVLTLVSSVILMPATLHYTHIAQEQSLSQMSADQAAAARETMAKIPSLVYEIGGVVGAIIVPWLVWLVGASVFLIGAALGGGEARFKNAWVSAVNTYGVAAIGSIISAIIVALRGADNVNSTMDLYASPSLAMLVHGSPKVAAFLYAFNVFNLWYYVVVIIALEHMLKLSRIAAIVTVVILALLSAGVGALFAK